MRTGPQEITDGTSLPSHFPQLDKICDAFESAWLAGKEPRIEDFTARVDEGYRTDLLKELLLAEWQLREQNGQPVEVQVYAERFPANRDLIAQLDRERCRAERRTSSAGLEVRCPHCRSRISLERDTPITDITCTSCGSHFSLVNDERETRGARTLQRLGQYELVELLGQGGFGSVWTARDTELDRTVAVKVPRRGGLTSQEVEQFLREARAVAQLRHPNIVSVHEVGRDGDTVFIVTDLVHGVTLNEWLTAKQPTFREVAELCAKIADALHHAHEAGVIHRDLKPRNILMARRDGMARVERRGAKLGRDEAGLDEPVLMDFGLARREAGEVTVTLEGQVLGTPAYMSPEQARGEAHQADRRTDVYSLGVILFELLSGELPFRGATRMLLHQVVHNEPRHPRSLNDRIPKDLETMCLKAMAKEASRRYATARDMADDLRRYLQGEPIHARPVGRAERAWRWCRRNPVVAGLSSGVVVSIGAVLLLLALYAIRERADATRERARALDLQHSLARQYLRRGQSLCEQGDLARGLHWLARSLKEAPEPSTALKEVIRENLARWQERWAPPRAVLEHEVTLNSAIALSPDGKRAVTGCFAGIVKFWSAETGQSLPLVRQHRSDVNRVAFSPDSTRVVSASSDHTAQLWDAETGTPVGDPLRHEDAVWDAAFSPDGTLVATASSDKTVCLWDSATGKPIGPPIQHDGPVRRVVFSSDGHLLLTAEYANGVARVWTIPSGASMGTAIQHQAGFTDVALSPDGKTVVTGNNDKTACLWSAESGLRIGSPMRHANVVNCVVFSPDGQRVLTGSADGTAQLWDARTAEPTDTVLEHEDSVYSAQFSADGKWLVTGSEDRTARLWDAHTGESLGFPFHHEVGISVVALAGRTVLTATNASVAALWTAEPATSQDISPPRAVLGSTLAFTPDGGRILLADESGRSATWWSPTTGQLERSTLWHGEFLWALALSADGRRAAVGGQGANKAQIWSLESGERLLFDLPHADQVRAVAFSPDAKLVATACFDGTARLWSADNGQPVGQPLRHSNMVEDVGFSPDGTLIVTACGDGAARIWSVETGHQVGPPLRHGDHVGAATFSPDGKLIATGSRDNTARFWDVATGRPVGSAVDHRGVDDVCFSPDGKRLATVSAYGSVRQWSIETGELLGPGRDLAGWPMEVAFSPDGKTIAVPTWGEDAQGTHLWTVPSPLGSDLADEEAELRVQVLTWTEMNANGVLRQLDRSTWQARREHLAELADP